MEQINAAVFINKFLHKKAFDSSFSTKKVNRKSLIESVGFD